MKVYRSRQAGLRIRDTYDKLLKEWGCEVKERDISVSYGTTHVIECGDENSAPLVLFHGVGDDSALMWIYNAEYLGRYFHVYAIDTIGGPGKSVPNENYNKTFDDIKWIDEVLDGLGISKAYFAGVSHGSYLVQAYTVSRSDRVIKGVCISGSAAVGGKKNSMKAMMKIFLPEALMPTDKNVSKLIKKLCGSRYGVFTENRTIMEHYKYLLKGFNNMAMRYHKISGYSGDQIGMLRKKLVYLVGEEDPFQKLGGKEILSQNHMETFFYKDAGHGLNHELSEKINKKMVSILQ